MWNLNSYHEIRCYTRVKAVILSNDWNHIKKRCNFILYVHVRKGKNSRSVQDDWIVMRVSGIIFILVRQTQVTKMSGNVKFQTSQTHAWTTVIELSRNEFFWWMGVRSHQFLHSQRVLKIIINLTMCLLCNLILFYFIPK